MALTPLTDALVPLADHTPATGPRATPTTGFSSSLTELLESVDATGQEANAAVTRMLDGSGDVHEAMIALQRAELSFQLTMQVRNKLVSAYQEIQRMPI